MGPPAPDLAWHQGTLRLLQAPGIQSCGHRILSSLTRDRKYLLLQILTWEVCSEVQEHEFLNKYHTSSDVGGLGSHW